MSNQKVMECDCAACTMHRENPYAYREKICKILELEWKKEQHMKKYFVISGGRKASFSTLTRAIVYCRRRPSAYITRNDNNMLLFTFEKGKCTYWDGAYAELSSRA